MSQKIENITEKEDDFFELYQQELKHNHHMSEQYYDICDRLCGRDEEIARLQLLLTKNNICFDIPEVEEVENEQ